MSTPQQPKGQQEGAKVDALMAVKMLERTLPAFGSQSDEGKAVLKAISALAKAFGRAEDKTQELMPAEMKTLLAGLSGPGAAGPPPGAAPPGPPAGAGAPPPG